MAFYVTFQRLIAAAVALPLLAVTAAAYATHAGEAAPLAKTGHVAAAAVVKTEHVEAQLVSDKRAAQPGRPLLVGLKLRMEPEWHTYWKNPGDSGLPTRIEWVLPEGWKAGDIQWPYPKPLPVGPLMNYGYEDEVVLLSQLTPPANAQPGPVVIGAKAEWLVCKDVCIPEKGELEIEMPVADGEAESDPRFLAHIERSKETLPVKVEGWKFESSLSGRTLMVRLTPPAGASAPKKVTFFPERELLIEPAAPQRLVREGDAVRIEMKLADPPLEGVTNVAGVAVAPSGWPGTARQAIEVDAPVSATPLAAAAPMGSARSASGNELGGSVLAALAFAFVGGILLNLMPCVFPVLGIKVMGFVEHAHGESRAMRLQGAIFTAGVILSFLVLAGLMLGLRAGGMQLGWGFQLQSPVVVTLLSGLFFLLALNLSGVFEWGLFAQTLTSSLSARGRYADAFVSGVLATVVATPCTAPFMGAAVGYTLTQDTSVSLMVFGALGVGMALPVLILSLNPTLLRKLPRPGAWMETFKQVLAFPLYATVAWLVWVLGAQAGNDAVLALLAGLVLLAMGAWMYGRWRHSTALWRPAVAILFAIAGLAVAWPAPQATGTPGQALATRAGELPWQEWSPERVTELTSQGRAVFVDFTAAWCVTCQVNKRIALNNDEVVKAFAARGVVPLRADWTRNDPRITDTLAALGRNAIPVYALYLPGEPGPLLLPEVLTPSLVLAELSRLPAVEPGTTITQR
jgi:thiol:disulfide interchange protein/DsbC/DsbD-like thiol-disulfide interchange protein